MQYAVMATCSTINANRIKYGDIRYGRLISRPVFSVRNGSEQLCT